MHNSLRQTCHCFDAVVVWTMQLKYKISPHVIA